MAFFNTTKKLILEIDEFFNAIDNGAIVFKEGVSNYIKGNSDKFIDDLKEKTKKIAIILPILS